MKTLTYICRHMVRTQRVPTIGFFTSARIDLWTQERKSEADYKEPDNAPNLSKSDNATILEFIDDFPEQLARFTGLGGRPLAYIIRELELVLPEANDPIFGEPNSQYMSVVMRSSRELPLEAQHSRLTTNGSLRYYEMQSPNSRPSKYGLRDTHIARTDAPHGKASPHTTSVARSWIPLQTARMSRSRCSST
jgi:hypothetical protein